MFKVGDLVTATAGVMRGRQLTVSYVGQRKVHEALGGGFFLYYRCLNEYGDEYLYANDELITCCYEDITLAMFFAGKHVKHSSGLFNALSMSVADLSIRHAVVSIPNIIEE